MLHRITVHYTISYSNFCVLWIFNCILAQPGRLELEEQDYRYVLKSLLGNKGIKKLYVWETRAVMTIRPTSIKILAVRTAVLFSSVVFFHSQVEK